MKTCRESFSLVGGTFEIVAFMDHHVFAEDIVHDHKVYLVETEICYEFLIVKLDFVQTEKLGDQRHSVLLEMLVVVFQNLSQEDELFSSDSLQHVATIHRVEEETATFAGTDQLCEGSQLTLEKTAYERFGPDAAQELVTRTYFLIIDAVKFPDVCKDIRRIVRERAGAFKLLVFVYRAIIVELEDILDLVVVIGRNMVVGIPDCSDGFVDADHHVDHQVPIFVEDEDHVRLLSSVETGSCLDVDHRLLAFSDFFIPDHWGLLFVGLVLLEDHLLIYLFSMVDQVSDLAFKNEVWIPARWRGRQ